jgi:hypothetical protein
LCRHETKAGSSSSSVESAVVIAASIVLDIFNVFLFGGERD